MNTSSVMFLKVNWFTNRISIKLISCAYTSTNSGQHFIQRFSFTSIRNSYFNPNCRLRFCSTAFIHSENYHKCNVSNNQLSMDTTICVFKEEIEINSKMCFIQWSAFADCKIWMDKLVANSTRTNYCKSYSEKNVI